MWAESQDVVALTLSQLKYGHNRWLEAMLSINVTALHCSPLICCEMMIGWENLVENRYENH